MTTTTEEARTPKASRPPKKEREFVEVEQVPTSGNAATVPYSLLEAYALESLVNSLATINMTLGLVQAQTKAEWATDIRLIRPDLLALERVAFSANIPPSEGWTTGTQAICDLQEMVNRHKKVTDATADFTTAYCPQAATLLLAKAEVRQALTHLKFTALPRTADNDLSMAALRYLTTLTQVLSLLAGRANRTYGSR